MCRVLKSGCKFEARRFNECVKSVCCQQTRSERRQQDGERLCGRWMIGKQFPPCRDQEVANRKMDQIKAV